MTVTAARPVVTRAEEHPGVSGGLAGGIRGREDLAGYERTGGLRPLADPEALLAAVSRAGLRGRGGAAFPLLRKLVAVREAARARGVPAVVVANGEEGEPASVKDRWLMRSRPHLVLDGLRLAAGLTGAGQLHAYVSDPESAASLRAAADAAGTPLALTVVEPRYVAGEETAAVRAIGGGPALPADKPPRPFEAGVGGLPTLVSNVETLAALALLHRGGPADTFLLTLTGAGRARLVEVPLGVTLREVLRDEPVRGLLMGGYFAGLAGPAVLDVPLDPDALRAAGTGLGCGAVAVLGPGRCPVAVAAEVMAYFARENAGQCGSCFNGTAAMAVTLGRLHEQRADAAEVAGLARRAAFLPGRGACGTPDGASALAASLPRAFPADVAAHLAGGCPDCPAAPPPGGVPFAVGLAPAEEG